MLSMRRKDQRGYRASILLQGKAKRYLRSIQMLKIGLRVVQSHPDSR
jgi:hypothetical protein